MSHYTTIQVQWTDPEAILDALAEYLTLPSRDAARYDPAGIPIRNFQGRLTGEAPDCEIVVGREHLGALRGDLGVKREADGKWVLHVDWYNWPKKQEQVIRELSQLYGYHKAKRLAEEAGYKVKKVTQEGGKIRLVLGRKVRA